MFCKFAQLLCRFVTKLLFFRTQEGVENIPETGGVVLCANHRSCWDPILISASMKRPLAFIGKAELFKNKLLAFVLRKLHCYPVQRGGGDLSIAKTALTLLKNGEALVIFPEGERIRKGKTPNPKPGAFRLAVMAGVPLVPIGICGRLKAFRKMHVRVGKPMDTAQLKGTRFTDEELKTHIGGIMETIYALAEEKKDA